MGKIKRRYFTKVEQKNIDRNTKKFLSLFSNPAFKFMLSSFRAKFSIPIKGFTARVEYEKGVKNLDRNVSEFAQFVIAIFRWDQALMNALEDYILFNAVLDKSKFLIMPSLDVLNDKGKFKYQLSFFPDTSEAELVESFKKAKKTIRAMAIEPLPLRQKREWKNFERDALIFYLNQKGYTANEIKNKLQKAGFKGLRYDLINKALFRYKKEIGYTKEVEKLVKKYQKKDV